MMKKLTKIILVLIMILGIGFSISNLISVKLKAGEKICTWVYRNGAWDCMGLGTDCDPFAFLPPG